MEDQIFQNEHSEWCRHCPDCGLEIKYKGKWYAKDAKEYSRRCWECSKKIKQRKSEERHSDLRVWKNPDESWGCKCPKCGTDVTKNSQGRALAFVRENRECRYCGYKTSSGSLKGWEGAWKGKKNPEHSDRMKEIMLGKSTKWLTGIPQSEESKQHKRDWYKEHIHPMQGKHHTQDAIDKMMESKIESDYNYKLVHLPDGRDVNVQGYEDWTIEKLLSEGILPQVMAFRKEEGRPTIKYLYEKHLWYFPDMCIIDKNIIVETKSLWTWNNEKPRNIAKINASIKAGYIVRLVIWDDRKCLVKDIIFTSEIINDIE